MSHIVNRVSASKNVHDYLEKRLGYSELLDPYSNDVDMLGCHYKGIKNLVYDRSLDTVMFSYTCTEQGFQNVLVFCDIPTAIELDSALDMIEEFKDINLSEYFSDAFCICWDYNNPMVLRLYNFKV